MQAVYYILLLLVSFCCTGCKARPTPVVEWEVSLVRPDGVTHKTFIIKSRLEPKCEAQWGGQTELYADQGTGVHGYKTTGLIAPTSWLWEIKSHDRLKN